jgi:hypothetical protein
MADAIEINKVVRLQRDVPDSCSVLNAERNKKPRDEEGRCKAPADQIDLFESGHGAEESAGPERDRLARAFRFSALLPALHILSLISVNQLNGLQGR